MGFGRPVTSELFHPKICSDVLFQYSTLPAEFTTKVANGKPSMIARINCRFTMPPARPKDDISPPLWSRPGPAGVQQQLCSEFRTGCHCQRVEQLSTEGNVPMAHISNGT